jgi:hypothetical protein
MEVTEAIVEPAKISIIVETSKVVLYYFPMKSFKYLPEDIKVICFKPRKLLSLKQRVLLTTMRRMSKS